MRAIILQGVSGSGKSSAVPAILERFDDPALHPCAPDAVVCSADDYFYDGGVYRFDPDKLGAAHAVCFGAYLHALAMRTPLVIVDNTNTTAIEVAPYMLAAAAHGYDACIVRVPCDLRLAASRNLHGVPLAGIERQNARIKSFDNSFGWPIVTLLELLKP